MTANNFADAEIQILEKAIYLIGAVFSGSFIFGVKMLISHFQKLNSTVHEHGERITRLEAFKDRAKEDF